MLKALTLALLLASAALLSEPNVHGPAADAAGPTIVSGVIAFDTTWSKVNSPYYLVGDVELLEGAHLHIEPGVSVLAAQGVYFTVHGSMEAVGTWDEPIMFSKLNSGKWGGLVLYGLGSQTVHLEAVTIEHAETGADLRLRSNAASLRVVDSTIQASTLGVRVRSRVLGEALVSHNVVARNMIGIDGGTALTFNVVTNNVSHGLTEPCSVRGSIITGNGGDGVNTTFLCELTDNLISGNGLNGVHWREQYGALHNNSLLGNGLYGVHTLNSLGGNAFGNWWGTTAPSAIAARIYDQNDNPAVGVVEFEPFLPGPARVPLANGRFDPVDMFGWQRRSVKGGIARIETLGTCFGANNTQGITFPEGPRVLNVRSSTNAPLESTGAAASAPFSLGSAISFQALSENDDSIPTPNPVSFQVRILEPITNEVWGTFDVKTNVLTTSPGTTNDGCLVGDLRDGPWSTHRIDTLPWAGSLARLEFRQHTNVPGKGFFTLIDDIVVEE